MTEPTRTLQIKYLTKRFGQQQIFQDLSLNLFSHSITGIVAPNGYGKSTLFQLIMDFLPADSGSITFFDGLSFQKELDYQRIREKVLLLPDQFDLHADLTGFQHLTIYQQMWHQTNARKKAIIAELGMTSFIKKPVKTYSLGMRQRLCFALLYLADGELLLLDELTNGLDFETIALLSKILLRLKNEGKTILLISHDLDHLQAIADDVYFLQDHQIGYHYPSEQDQNQMYLRIKNEATFAPRLTAFAPLKTGDLYQKDEKLVHYLLTENIPFEFAQRSLTELFAELYQGK